MKEFLKPAWIRDNVWANAPSYTTFAAAGVSGAGFAGALTGMYQLLFEEGDFLKSGAGALIGVLVGKYAGDFGHKNLENMEEKRLAQAGTQAVAELTQPPAPDLNT